MAMGACPGQIPMPCVPPALMVTATMVRACRYTFSKRSEVDFETEPGVNRKNVTIFMQGP